MKKLLALAFLLFASPAWAQNPTCPTRPVGDSTNACASTAFVQQNGANALNIACNVKDIGSISAKGDGFTNDTPAYRFCRDILLSTFGGGVVNVPASQNPYCLSEGFGVDTGLSTNGAITFQGSGFGPSIWSACGNDVTLFRTNNQWTSLRDIQIQGYGVRATDPVFTGTLPTKPAVQCDAAASFFNMSNVSIIGGTANLLLNCSNYHIQNISTGSSYTDASHVLAMVVQNGGGGSLINSHLDQGWPVLQPLHNTAAPIAWINAHTYTLGDRVIVTCAGRTWIIQAHNTGTTGSSPPSCKPFGTFITDNVTGSCPSPSAGICWLLDRATTFYCMQVDSLSVEVQLSQIDMTCSSKYNFAMTNTYSSTPPGQVSLTNITPGGGSDGNIYIGAGSSLTMTGVEESNCITPGCAAIYFDTGFSGVATVNNNRALNGLSYGFVLAGGSSITINGGVVSSADVAGVQINAANHFIINGGIYGSGITGTSIVSAASAAIDYCIITNNIFHGASTPAFTQGAGSCANKTVSGNL